MGHSYSPADSLQDQQLALNRAKAVQDALVKQGINLNRLQVTGVTNRPRELDYNQPLWLSRYVEFRQITPSIERNSHANDL